MVSMRILFGETNDFNTSSKVIWVQKKVLKKLYTLVTKEQFSINQLIDFVKKI